MGWKLEYDGKKYKNVVEMGKNIPLLTSVLVQWTDDADWIAANAAANCYDTNITYGGKLAEKIVLHCVESGHNTVYEHNLFTFFKKVPIFVARQDLRARHASFDERSLRYCRADNESLTYYLPDYLSETVIERTDDKKKQQFLKDMREEWIELHERTIRFYSKYTDEELNEIWNEFDLNGERVRETVRATLPLGINTMYMDSRNAASWIHHSAKRLCLRAQKEIRLIAYQQIKQLKEVAPIIFGGVNRPCMMSKGCTEARKCGVTSLEETGRWEVKFYEKIMKPKLYDKK
ncbi:MAG: FAD-dependent thymidylate synthase [Clostridia bacterium]|nr:FAD-dependent thymidylate synthase [Clostridia bacterium]MDD4048352.1 FAD-dependent thymidylate synthase [Clostridia bacterium]